MYQTSFLNQVYLKFQSRRNAAFTKFIILIFYGKLNIFRIKNTWKQINCFAKLGLICKKRFSLTYFLIKWQILFYWNEFRQKLYKIIYFWFIEPNLFVDWWVPANFQNNYMQLHSSHIYNSINKIRFC